MSTGKILALYAIISLLFATFAPKLDLPTVRGKETGNFYHPAITPDILGKHRK